MITASTLQVLDVASGEVATVLEATPPDVVGAGGWSPDGRRLLLGQARLRARRSPTC